MRAAGGGQRGVATGAEACREFRQAADVHCPAPVTGARGSEISRLLGREGGIGKSRISSERPVRRRVHARRALDS